MHFEIQTSRVTQAKEQYSLYSVLLKMILCNGATNLISSQNSEPYHIFWMFHSKRYHFFMFHMKLEWNSPFCFPGNLLLKRIPVKVSLHVHHYTNSVIQFVKGLSNIPEEKKTFFQFKSRKELINCQRSG